MDELLKLLKELLEREPTPKGGIANTPAGIDFIGRTLTKEEKGADMILSGKLTDASRFKPFAIQNIGRDERYRKINEYYGDIQKSFEKSINFLKQNPDIRITSEIRDNVLYNLGVLRRIQDEKTKLEKGILSENKTLESILKPEDDVIDLKTQRPVAKDLFDQVLDDLFPEMKSKKFKIKKDKVDEIVDNINNMESIAAMKEMNNVIARQGKYKNLTDDEVEKIYESTINKTSGRSDFESPFFKGDVEDQFDIEAFAKQLEKSKKDSDHKAKMKRLYEGPGYDNPNSPNYRGYGSFFLPKLHEKGIINLDEKIYNNLVKGAHHYGGGEFFAPDPIRIWRKHFGNDVFQKLDNFDPKNEDIFKWLDRNNIQPILKQGPEDALEYQTTGELLETLGEDLDAFGKYKNPKGQGGFFEEASAEQRLERLGYHGENIQRREAALQRLDPDAFREYSRTKPKFEGKILPFKELNAEGGIVGLYI